MTNEEKAGEVIKRLSAIYPNPKTALVYKTPFELLVATVLSAQTTDKLVNTITPPLFEKFPNPKEFSVASIEEIDEAIKKVNFHKNKATFLKKLSEKIVSQFGGEVPQTMSELTSLPGVARKTANVVLGNAFGISEGIAVDTHVMRITRLLGLTTQKDPQKIEQDLIKIVPKESWIDFTHLLINYGREYCPARIHDHSKCPLGDLYIS